MTSLDSKVAIVTGGAGGMCAATARRMAACGARVVARRPGSRTVTGART